MGEIIQIKVEKDGVGKTFITSNLAHLLVLLEYRVIILSIDSQNNVYSISPKCVLVVIKSIISPKSS